MNPHQNRSMRVRASAAIAVLSLGIGISVFGQSKPSKVHTAHSKPAAPDTVSADDGLSIIAAALDPAVRRYAGHDCSHLVHAIYERAGFSYTYANSDAIYDGVAGFRRVTLPQPGDIIVWHEHTGIVVRPSHHVFFSFMSKGPGVDDYESQYWKSRGHPRFYRFVRGSSCLACASAGQPAGSKQVESAEAQPK